MERPIHRTSQVFVPGGMPKYTYISRAERNLESVLRRATDHSCKLTTINGSTKSGKTVLTNTLFPRGEETVWIDGGSIREEHEIWLSILSELGGYTDLETEDLKENGSNLQGQLELSVGVEGVASVGSSLGGGRSGNMSSSVTQGINLPPVTAALKALRESGCPLIFDDFHYIDRQTQGSIIRALKPLIFEGHTVILIAIPHRRYDAVKVEREITGRLTSITIPSWSEAELLEIPYRGFPLLNMTVGDKTAKRLAEEAYGSPHLMQEFCKEIAFMNEIEETLKDSFIIESLPEKLFQQVAEGTGKTVFEKLAKGPRQRSDRLQREMNTGEAADIYKVVLFALSRLSPGMETIEYEELRGAIRDILKDNVPRAHEVTRVLEQMAKISSSDEASTPVLDWEKEEQKLHITDPFFAFFLKWGLSEDM